MRDEEALSYFEESLKKPTGGFNIVHNGKVRILGLALQKMLVKGPPSFYIALDTGDRVKIYDLEYSIEGTLESCRKVARLKRVDPKLVGHNRINGQDLYNACVSNGFDSPRKIKAEHFYDFPYEEPTIDFSVLDDGDDSR